MRAAWLDPGEPPGHAVSPDGFPLFPGSDPMRASYAVGQNMDTPEDIELRNPARQDPLCPLALRLDRARRRERRERGRLFGAQGHNEIDGNELGAWIFIEQVAIG